MNQVTYTVTIEQEDIPVRGNYMCSDDEAFNKQCEDEVIEKLENGYIEAWCYVKVTASTAEGFEGFAGIGCCTLSSEYTAEQCAEEYGLHEEALDALKLELARAVQSGEAAAALLTALETK